MPSHGDPRRPDRVRRYQPSKETDSSFPAEHINAVGMVCSLLGLIIRVSHQQLVYAVHHTAVLISMLILLLLTAEVGGLDWSLLFSDLPCKFTIF